MEWCLFHFLCVLLWTWMDKYLFKYLLRILLGIYVEVELLRNMIILCLIFGRSINVLLKSHLRGKIELQILKVKWVNMHCWPPFLSWGIVDVQYYINFRCTTQWFTIFFKVIEHLLMALEWHRKSLCPWKVYILKRKGKYTYNVIFTTHQYRLNVWVKYREL